MLSITNEYARDFIAACERVSTFPLPGDGEVFFYLVTSDAVYQAKCMEDALAEQRSLLRALQQLSRGHVGVREIEQHRKGPA